ncbi:uncharacterized protein CIMG_13258 [Coccidioides immitis RS]|uniref:Uncharacterized protein n=1 Tax=Coccidioides immitis (strain RS) TaxID=246410 RepID=A0A0D8JUL7_COCIM|nr:uncharacterized protein CIMG_13258 [Coccidioides immitis RS]KJF60819.1 hypothetical protein CIMG_13258 [Coccidioides immitis RS]
MNTGGLVSACLVIQLTKRQRLYERLINAAADFLGFAIAGKVRRIASHSRAPIPVPPEEELSSSNKLLCNSLLTAPGNGRKRKRPKKLTGKGPESHRPLELSHTGVKLLHSPSTCKHNYAPSSGEDTRPTLKGFRPSLSLVLPLLAQYRYPMARIRISIGDPLCSGCAAGPVAGFTQESSMVRTHFRSTRLKQRGRCNATVQSAPDTKAACESSPP